MTEPNAYSIAGFLRAATPINFSPVHLTAAVAQNIPTQALANPRFQKAVFSTGLFGTGLLAALYTGLFDRRSPQPRHNANDTFTPVQWLDYPAHYVPPKMDMFSEDQVPFGVSPSFSCPQDSEHLERAFDVLRSQHLFKKLGVPSVVNQRSPHRLLRVLGNTSSGSRRDLEASAKILSSFDLSYGGPQENNGDFHGSMGGQKNAYVDNTALSSTRLPQLSADEKPKGVSVLTAFLVVSAIVLGILAKRSLRHQPSSEPSATSEPFTEIPEDGNGNDKDSFPPTTATTDIRAFGPRRPRNVKSRAVDPYLADISTTSLAVAIQVFCLLARRGRVQKSSPEPSTTLPHDIWDLLDDGNGRNKGPHQNSAPAPSTRLVLGLLMNTEQCLERLFEDDPLVGSYTPFVTLAFPNDDSHVWSDAPLVEDTSAPVDFAAQFDALRDAIRSFLGLWKTTEMSLLDLGRLVVFGMGIFLCVGLRLMVFLVTGRFGCRGIHQLVEQFKYPKPSDAMLSAEFANVLLPSLGDPLGSESSGLTSANVICNDAESITEGIVGAFTAPLRTSSTSTTLVESVEEDETIMSSTTCVDLAVETSLAPAVNKEIGAGDGDGEGWTVVTRRRKPHRKGGWQGSVFV